MSFYEKELSLLDKRWKQEIEFLNNKLKTLKNPLRPPVIHIGTNALSGKKLYLPIEKPGLASTHTYIIGSSGMGKSKFLERIARDLIKHRYGVLVLDGKNDLYDDLLDFCCFLDLTDRTILIDPNDYEYSVGINYLELLGNTTPEALAGMVLEGLKKFFKEDNQYKPWLEEWAPVSLVPLIKAKFTLLELFYFLSFKNPTFRNTLLQQQNDPFYKDKWDELIKFFRQYDQANILNVLKTRATKFWTDQSLKYIFGQGKTTLNWLKIMNEGGIVLAKLGNTERVSLESCRLLGIAILHQLTCLAPSRPQNKRRPFFVIIDEFQKFITPDIADSLDRLRGFGIHFILSHQSRGQIEKEDPYLLDSIDSNCLNRVVFHISPKDAKVEMENLFAGWIRADRPQDIKDEIWQTKFRPIKTYETIVTETESESSQKRSSSYSIVPWYDYEEFEELTSRTYYTIEEIKEKYIAWIEMQDERKAQWRFLNRKPLPIITPWIERAIISETKRQAFKKKIYSLYCRSTQDIEKEIEERIKKFLEEKKNQQILEINFDEPISFRVKRKTSSKENNLITQ